MSSYNPPEADDIDVSKPSNGRTRTSANGGRAVSEKEAPELERGHLLTALISARDGDFSGCGPPLIG